MCGGDVELAADKTFLKLQKKGMLLFLVGTNNIIFWTMDRKISNGL